MATLLKVLNNLADIKSAGGVALRVRTQDASMSKMVNAVHTLARADRRSRRRSISGTPIPCC
jgi:hypothetical protein